MKIVCEVASFYRHKDKPNGRWGYLDTFDKGDERHYPDDLYDLKHEMIISIYKKRKSGSYVDSTRLATREVRRFDTNIYYLSFNDVGYSYHSSTNEIYCKNLIQKV